MRSKTRKFIGPMSLVAIFAVVGALAAFVVLGTGIAQAQSIDPRYSCYSSEFGGWER